MATKRLKSTKKQNKLVSLLARPKLLVMVLFALIVGSVGTYTLMQSHALATIAPPTNLTVSVTSPTSTQLYWWPSTATPAPAYNVFRDGVKIAFVGSWLTFDGRVPYTDSGLTPGTSYTYYVEATNTDGLGDSTPVTVTTSQAPTADQLGTISGVVSGNRKVPVSGAQVLIYYLSVTHTYTTGADGSYTIPNVPAGSYSLSVSAAGYKTANPRVNVVGGQTVNLPVSLKTSR